ncbi:MAG: tripartite tricarboxylate transporter permease [archaeon]|nr:MAG: tripartite tricarboxylate transporter permease [archaeon]
MTGLVPGLHPNTICILFLGFVFGDPLLVSVLIVSSAIAHSFLDFLPSILLGAPDPGTALSVLPGHNMMMQGRAYEAIRLTVIGGLASLLIALTLMPLLMFFVGSFYDFIRPNIHWLLVTITGFMFLKDRKPWSLVVFAMSGALGYLVLNGNLLGRFSLLPMLTGLFGLSMIIKSLKDRTRIPEQKISADALRRIDVVKGGLVGSLSGILVGLLPGVGAAQATFISREVLRDRTEKKFMIAMGGVNTVVAIFSLLALWIVGNPRSGVAVAVDELMGVLTFGDVIIFIGAIALAGGLSSLITIYLSKRFINFFRRIDYRKVSLSIIIFLIAITFVFTGAVGTFVLFLSTAIGMVCILTNTRRSYMMACIIVPTVLFFI